MVGGVIHGCKIGSEGLGDSIICLKNVCDHPGASPANEGIGQCSYVFLATIQNQIRSMVGEKTHVVDAEGKPFVPNKLAERSRVMR